jgi:hypothetical protein
VMACPQVNSVFVPKPISVSHELNVPNHASA